MKRIIRTNKAPKPAAAYEQGIASGGFLFVSGQTASNPKTGTIEKGSIEEGSIGEQVAQALRNIEAIVQAAGGTRDNIVRCGVFLADLNDFAAMNGAYREFFSRSLPARTTVQAGLGGLRVEIDAIAVLDSDTGSRSRRRGQGTKKAGNAQRRSRK